LLFLSDCFRRHLLGYIKSLDGRRVDVGLDPSPFPVRLGDGVFSRANGTPIPKPRHFDSLMVIYQFKGGFSTR
jgi:hypothetical protein